MAQRVKNLSAMQETWVRSLRQEDSLAKEKNRLYLETVVERGRIFFPPVPQVLARVLPSLGSMKRGTGTSLSSVASLPGAGPQSATVLSFWSP